MREVLADSQSFLLWYPATRPGRGCFLFCEISTIAISLTSSCFHERAPSPKTIYPSSPAIPQCLPPGLGRRARQRKWLHGLRSHCTARGFTALVMVMCMAAATASPLFFITHIQHRVRRAWLCSGGRVCAVVMMMLVVFCFISCALACEERTVVGMLTLFRVCYIAAMR